jgi:hypothetical protein
MDTKQIRQLLREGASVVLLEEGETPLVVRELAPSGEPALQEVPEEVPIASRWPKGLPTGQAGPPEPRVGRSILDRPPEPSRTDHILERLNKEILALKAEIAQQEEQNAGEEEIH